MTKKEDNLIIKINRKIVYMSLVIIVFFLGAIASFVLVDYGLIRENSNRLSYGAKTSVLGESEQASDEVVKDLPEGFPERFPVIENAILLDSWSVKSDAARGLSVVWKTSLSVSELSNYYKGVLEKDGWELNVVSETTSTSTISFGKEDAFGNEVCIETTFCEIAGFISINNEADGGAKMSVTIGIKRN